MSTVTTNKASTTPAKHDKKADGAKADGAKKEKKPGKPWINKRLDNTMRALRAAKNVHDRFAGAAGAELRTDFKDKTKEVASMVTTALRSLETAAKVLTDLKAAGYKPTTEKVKLAAGVQVWIKGGVWRKKYAGLYKPEEMDGLTIVSASTDGRFVRVKSTSGLQFGDASSSFKTSPVDYAEAVKEETVAA